MKKILIISWSITAYEDIAQDKDWKILFQDNVDKQYEIAKIVKMRHKVRQDKIDKFEAGQAGGSGAPGNCWGCSTFAIFVLHSGNILIDWHLLHLKLNVISD